MDESRGRRCCDAQELHPARECRFGTPEQAAGRPDFRCCPPRPRISSGSARPVLGTRSRGRTLTIRATSPAGSGCVSDFGTTCAAGSGCTAICVGTRACCAAATCAAVSDAASPAGANRPGSHTRTSSCRTSTTLRAGCFVRRLSRICHSRPAGCFW